MQKTMFGRLCGAVLALALVGPAQAKDFSKPLALPANTLINFTIQHEIHRTAEGTTPASDLTVTVRYRLNVDPNTQGYHVKINVIGVDLPSRVSALDRMALTQASSTLSGLEYQADQDLMPVEVLNWTTQAGKLADSFADLMGVKHDDPAITGMRDLYAAMTPAQASDSLLQEWSYPAIVQNVELDLGPALKADTSAPGAGGQQLKRQETMQLKSVSRSSNKATIEFHSAFDPASANAVGRATVAALQAQIPTFPKYSEAQLARLQIDETMDCAYEMDIRTGLATKSDCTKTAGPLDEKGTAKSQTDHWVITQAIVAK